MKKETLCVHKGTIEDKIHGGVISPIYTSSAFLYLNRKSISYPRYFNTPNQQAVVEKVCSLEGAEDGVLFSSGMAAMTTTVLTFTGAGDRVVMMDELYGGTHAFAGSEFPKLGIDWCFTATDADSVCEAIDSKTKVVVIESPTNPLLSVIDIKKVASFARKKKVLTVIDNTFATPLYQNPLALGIDVIVHSGTKYLGGHSDICCGIVLTTRELTTAIRKTALSYGGSLNGQTCALLERSLMTLAIRVGRQTENAGRIARHLEKSNNVARVNYPGLKSSAYYKLAKKQMDGFGAMLSFELDVKKVNPVRFIRALRVIKPAVSLGSIESTICAPAVTSHAKISAAERRRIGISNALLRLSVGIEQADDLIEDIEQAMSA